MTKRQRFRNVPKDKVTGAEVRAVTDIPNDTNRAPPEVVAEQATAAPCYIGPA